MAAITGNGSPSSNSNSSSYSKRSKTNTAIEINNFISGNMLAIVINGYSILFFLIEARIPS